jgi:hypothetical protein
MDWEAGPVSRPYTVTGGRTEPRSTRRFDLVDVVARSARPVTGAPLPPESARILELCLIPVAVAELASAVGLPLGVVRVLLDDLVQEGLIDVRSAAPRGQVTDRRLLQKVLNGLQAL